MRHIELYRNAYAEDDRECADQWYEIAHELGNALEALANAIEINPVALNELAGSEELANARETLAKHTRNDA